MGFADWRGKNDPVDAGPIEHVWQSDVWHAGASSLSTKSFAVGGQYGRVGRCDIDAP
jgi:hypothetical protein